KRPAGTRYDSRKWTIALPVELTAAIASLPGVSRGWRIYQAFALPQFVLEEACPVALVREFLAALFGADGHAPVLRRQGPNAASAVLAPPAYAQSAKREHVELLKEVMQQIIRLLVRCGVKARGARIYAYPTRRSTSTYPSPRDGEERIEVRLALS